MALTSSLEDTFHLGVKALIFGAGGKILLLERNHPVKKLCDGRILKNQSFKL